MLDKRKEYLSELYNHIADELSISPTMAEKARKSYEAVGEWLGECEPGLDVRITPQGSMNLGTVTKPLTDEDDYDIDLVCILANGKDLQAEEIKQIVGKRLKEHKTYRSMLEEEGKRCWTLQYEEFHMDILPSVPRYNAFIEPNWTDIRLTHKVSEHKYEDKYSNPYQYKLWFEECMQVVLTEAKTEFAVREKVEIDEVPTYKVKTPLQKAIQLLKRHRDIMFEENDKDDAPISIIITTLAAKAYRNEANLYDALTNIITHMTDYIEKDANGQYKIKNPVIDDENFAEKWNQNPNKAKCFYKWIKAAREDIINRPFNIVGTEEISKVVKESFGENITNRAYNRIAENSRMARNNQLVYVNGLQGGITTKESLNSRPIPEHTFYGKK